MASDLAWTISSGNESSNFYCMMLPSILHEKKLRIPGKFMKNIGRDLSSVAALTTPNGYVWSVRLQNMVHTRLARVCRTPIYTCSLLVFTYKGISNFVVNIFDMTSVEIKYHSLNQFPVSEGAKFE